MPGWYGKQDVCEPRLAEFERNDDYACAQGGEFARVYCILLFDRTKAVNHRPRHVRCTGGDSAIPPGQGVTFAVFPWKGNPL